MSYELQFHPDAWDEWNRLDKSVREQLKKKLLERLEEPHIPASRLSGRQNRYKIKLKTVGYRLVYEVLNDRLIVLVVAVGRHDRNAVYTAAARRQTHVSG
ncbi:type II toxin-antitoxin system RelE family toxin [Allochromatium vinosum]|uniref:type II toxin-antitoxin system RelE family toxin n=1 Tax=Allochromatium vinosum TaxID=1049 RepID=UPI001906187A|nr:type II toxin-antitoxin system RelE/ParE family toxin [Allochromatium vinosum]MBK1654233.1 type II toxin-antitoxin system mRNA interferase toxin, RelE/StbE family [Allochromatium vinosum]